MEIRLGKYLTQFEDYARANEIKLGQKSTSLAGRTKKAGIVGGLALRGLKVIAMESMALMAYTLASAYTQRQNTNEKGGQK